MRYSFLILLMLLAGRCFSQLEKIDSLQNLSLNVSGIEKAKVLNKLSEAVVYTKPVEALKIGQEALRLAVKLKNDATKYEALRNIGYANGYMGDFHESIKNMEDGLEYYKSISDSVNIAKALNDIGYLKIALSDISTGVKYYEEALEIRERINDQLGISYSLNNLGTVCWQWGKTDDALAYYLKALPYLEENRLYEEYATVLGNIGVIYSDKMDSEKALEYYNRCLEINRQLDHNIGIAKMLSNIANLYADQKKFEKANGLYDEAEQIRKRIGDKEGLVLSWCNMGRLHELQANYQKSIVYFKRAEKLADSIGMKTLLLKSYEGLSGVYEKLNSYQLALKYFRKSANLNDSIFNAEKHHQIEELKTKYETEKKVLEIENLQKENNNQQLVLKRKQYLIYILIFGAAGILSMLYLYFSRRQSIAERKSIELEQKLLRLQMNPHFIFNSISVIQSYVFNNSKKDAVNYLSAFASLMRLILENSVTEYIPFEKEKKTLEFYLHLQSMRYPGKFSYNIIDEEIDEENLMVPPMLGQPFIENAIEHGLKNNQNDGQINVRYKMVDDHLLFEVDDNGVGIKQSGVLEGDKEHQSMAINITRERLRILNRKGRGKLDFSIQDKSELEGKKTGTVVKFLIPVVNEF